MSGSASDPGAPEAGAVPPERVVSQRLVLRCWDPSDAPALKRALARTWDDLQRWIPWVFPVAESVEELENRLAKYRRDFLGGRDALYGVWTPDEEELVGGAGLYRRVGPGALEIGYWVRGDRKNQGIATEAARLLTEVGKALPGIDVIEIRVDPDHHASQAIPRKLGYTLREVLPPDPDHPGGPRKTAVWVR